MKRALIVVLSGFLVAGTWAPSAKAASEAEKTAAILAGIAHLISIQAGNGSWTSNGYVAGPTGAAAFAVLGQRAKWPAAQQAAYQTAMTNAMNYLLANATKTTVSTRSDGLNICPAGSGNCTGVYWYGEGEQTYSTGLVAPAIDTWGALQGANAVATTTGPLANMTWGQIAQGITNTFAAAQSTSSGTVGGWRYNLPANADADGSTTQWAVLSFIYDESLGATTPAGVKTSLKTWLATAIQANSGTGAACYDGFGDYCDHSDTGAWELAKGYVGSNLDAQQLAGISFLNTNWKQAPFSTWLGHVGHPYAMWSVYKGLDTTIGLADNSHIHNFITDCGASGGDLPASNTCNWWEDYNHYLVKHQNGNGSWPDASGAGYWSDPISTSFFVSILGAVAVPVPGGPSAPSTVPVLSKWGLVTLAILLAGFAAMSLRRPRTV